MFLFPSSILANDYHFGIGSGNGELGESDATNLSIEAGTILNHDYPNYLLGFGIGVIFNADNYPTNTLEYSASDKYSTSLGTRQKHNEFVFFGKYGIQPIEKYRVFLFGLGGISYYKEVELARSTLTGRRYEQSSSTIVESLYGGGIGYFPKYHQLFFQVEYDNRRGITGTIGFQW